jgi:hypothetical protein
MGVGFPLTPPKTPYIVLHPYLRRPAVMRAFFFSTPGMAYLLRIKVVSGTNKIIPWILRHVQQLCVIILLSEIVTIAEGSIDTVFCVNDPAGCSRSKYCVWRDVWSELKLRTMDFMNSITLSDMLERQTMKLKNKTKKSKV